ncbi:hypothetical protein PoB_002587300 [Plakobranchus ocellatus]|uniref:Uncharacterized protein n=1 Tax=Plakobranchus ocellatus TaxID=259542 RepID=A0AAV3ZY87_9GAST|nr:hypothetical protein PoB_002587300 [Plakobranchus ocellatus]
MISDFQILHQARAPVTGVSTIVRPGVRRRFEHVTKRGVGGSVAIESALRSAGTHLSWVRAPPPAPWPDGGPESLRSPCCELAI